MFTAIFFDSGIWDTLVVSGFSFLAGVGSTVAWYRIRGQDVIVRPHDRDGDGQKNN